MKLRFGVSGLGFAGAVLMAPHLHSHPHAEIAAACDPHEGVRVGFGEKYGIPAYATLDEMLAAERLDALYVASPHQFHCEQVLLACARGLHVLVEKPLALTLAEADRMVEAAKQAKVQLVVGPSRSHDPVIRTMRQLVLGGEFGRLGMIHCLNYTDFLYRPRRPEELDTAQGGGIVYNQLPHQVDSVRAISGCDVVAVRAITARLAAGRPTEGNCSALLTLEGGACATLVYSGYDHFDSDELQFWIGEGGGAKTPSHGRARSLLKRLDAGADGTAEAKLRRERYGFGGAVSKAMAASTAPRRQPHFGLMIATCEKADLRPSADGVLVYGDEGPREVPAIRGRGTDGQGDAIDELYDAIIGEAPVLRDAAWGRDTLAVCLAVLQSSSSGEQVALR